MKYRTLLLTHTTHMGSNAPMLASTGTCVVLVGKVDDSAYADLRATAMLRHWHAFFAGIDACKPEQAYLAGRDTAHFEYVLPADTFTTCQPQQSSDAAVEAMSRFAMDVLQYSNKVRGWWRCPANRLGCKQR